MSEDDDPQFTFKIGAPRRTSPQATDSGVGESRYFDARGLAQLLFSEIATPQDVFEMFKKLGPMDVNRSEGTAPPIHYSAVRALIKQFEANLLRVRKHSMTHASATGGQMPSEAVVETSCREIFEYLRISHHIDIALPFDKDKPALVYRFDVRTAMEARIFLCKRDDVKWRRCERKDCKKLVQQRTNRIKRYCGIEDYGVDCAHVQYMRNLRHSGEALRGKSATAKGM